jgi:hypothetical protein
VITILAWRHLLVRKLRSIFLLFGFALGVGVMIVLLSVGEAMLDQSRDVSLVGGGQVTVLPQGIDIEAMRTGGLGGMFFGIDRARFLGRQILGGARHRILLREVSPTIDGKLLYLRRGDRILPVRAGGEIPSRAAGVGSALNLSSGRWKDSGPDSAYIAPTPQQLYDELDRFHLPAMPDSSWGEWHYFNLVTSPSEWWYVTYLIGGEVSRSPAHRDQWGGRLLITHRQPDGRYERHMVPVRSSRVAFDTARADLTLGESSVRQTNGTYRLQASVRRPGGMIRMDVTVSPASNRYFPPVQLQDEDFVSGYVVPALAASASGSICIGSRCTRLTRVPAYHDHNWGVWRDVTWEWGAASGSRLSFIYGGVYRPRRSPGSESSSITSPFFLALLDSLGVKQVLRFDRVRYAEIPASRPGLARYPGSFGIVATRETDTLRLDVRVLDALATDRPTGLGRRAFLQMRGEFHLNGRVLGQTVADSGNGFFETYISP